MVAVSCEVGWSNSCPARLAVILENADVLEAAVALQILNPLRGQTQKLFDLNVAGIPDMAIVARIFQQNFVRSHRSHAVVESVAAAGRLAFDVVKRLRMHNRARRPRAAIHAGQGGDDLRGLGGRTAKRQACERGVGSMTSSPVITQERVMGSLRSSMAVRRTK